MVKVIGGAQEGEFKAVASGTLPNGKPVVVNSDGTVSVVATSGGDPSFGSSTVFDTGARAGMGIAFDSNANRIVISYADINNSNYGTAVVGQVSGTSITFGTPVVFESASTESTSVVFDSNLNKIVIGYVDKGNTSSGTAIVGTTNASNNSISFGSATVFLQGYADRITGVFDSNSNKVVFSYRVNYETGYSSVGTVSGTGISFGSAVGFNTGGGNIGSTFSIASVFDTTNNKVVIFYRGVDNDGQGIVGTVSGTSISFGTAVDYTSNTANYNEAVFDPDTGKVIIVYQDATNSSYGTSVIGTVSGTSISFGTPAVFLSAVPDDLSIAYDALVDKAMLFYNDNNVGYYKLGTVSGTSVSFNTAAVSNNGNGASETSSVFDSTSNGVVFSYRDGANSNAGVGRVYNSSPPNLTTENYIGMSSGAVTPSVNGTKTSFNSSAIGSEVTGSVYDPDTGKIIICYTRGSDNHGLAVVGTVSGTTLSFGTPVVFNAAVTDHTDITYDTANNKVLIVYKNVGNNNYGTAIVGTVSGTSISFGTPVVYFSARSHNNKATFDTNAGKSLVVWLDDDNNDVESAVATISGTNVSFGSTVTVDANANSNEVVFDSNSNKVVVVYKDLGNSNYGTAIVGTISGTSVSFGSEVVFNPGSTSDIHCAFDSTNNKVIISFKAGSDGDKAKAIVGTVSGTAISFGSLATINDAASQQPKPVYNSVQQNLIFEYELSGNGLYYRTASVSGTSIVNIGAQVTLASGFNALVSNLVYHPTEDVAVVGFKDSGDSNKGNAIAFSTEVRGEVASGGNATVDIIGSLSTNQGGLTAGQQYFVQTDGTLSETPADPSVLAGTALSATKMTVKS